MRIRCFTFSVLGISLAITLALPAALTAKETDDSAASPLMQALQQVVSLQEAWMDEHQCYGSLYDLAEHVDGQVLDDNVFPASGGVIHQLLAVDSQAYILLARDLSHWEYITAASSGEVFQGRTSDPDRSASAAVAALVWAENAMLAKSGRYGWIGDLRDAGLLGDHWAPYMDVKSGEVVLLDSGAVLTLSAYPTNHIYEIVAECGTGSIQTNAYRESIERNELISDYETLLLEKARNCLRTVISANAAHYAFYGEYNTLPLLAERKMLSAEYGETDPADLKNGIRALVVVQEDGQAYDAVTAVMGIMYYGNETGEIRQYSADEPADIPEVEAMRSLLKDLMD